jgi:hypothetical protein
MIRSFQIAFTTDAQVEPVQNSRHKALGDNRYTLTPLPEKQTAMSNIIPIRHFIV